LMKMFIDRIRNDIKRIAGHANGLPIYILILTVFIAPIHPLELIPL